MRLTLAIFAASLVYSVLTASFIGQFIGSLDHALLERVAEALR